MHSKIEPEFRQRLEAAKTQRVDVIIRTSSDPRECAEELIERGLLIRHTYSLIKALSASGLGLSILELAQEPWIVKIEPDEDVRAMA